jgi:hypothetical protein
MGKRREPKIPWLFLVVLVVAWQLRRETSTAPGSSPLPAGQPSTPPAGITPISRTGTGGSREWWKTSRLAALNAAGVTGAVAQAILAQWALETGFGAGEWNFNLGNLLALSGKAHWLGPGSVATGQGGWFAAYNSLEEGVTAYLRLLHQPRYAECFAMLQLQPENDAWIRCMGQKGYYTASQDKYAKGWADALAELAPRATRSSA